ncbi:hypothetical protein PF005_g6934 [Phytophthora fragariae]|uniref:DUF4371 domain-containing protein n=3 Tax=Phytophthora fragariae TaxID=53985 RepID=A0A6A3YQR4_9STRA|nr:hypothetical protein PF005_g6934 [Phytophthora fragariae]
MRSFQVHCSEVMMVEKDVSTFCQPSKGFRNWKKAMAKSGGFLTHIGDKLAKHRHAEAAFAELLCPTHNIEVALTAADNTQRINNRRRLGLIFDICMHLARQGIPFRGNDEKTTSMNKGNFLEMIDFMKEHVPEFSQLMRSAAGNAMYTSPDIQKQLVQCAADIVRKHIVRVELTGGVFSILVDEASCEAKRENMSIVIRFVCAKTGAIKERCLGVVHRARI